MSESTETIYFITGATRGLGLALVDDIASKDSGSIIYAGAREPSGSGASKLKEVAAKYPGRIELVKYVSGDTEGNEAIAKEIGMKHGHVDTIVANAGISNYYAKIHEIPIHEYSEHFSINVIGSIVLFQTFYNLLKASAFPRFVPISSNMGSLELISFSPIDVGPYGVSKAALNWVARKIHFENEWLVCFPICPGVVYTDMAKQSAATDPTGTFSAQLESYARPPHVAASLVWDIIRESTREKEGGQFVNVEGKRHPW